MSISQNTRLAQEDRLAKILGFEPSKERSILTQAILDLYKEYEVLTQQFQGASKKIEKTLGKIMNNIDAMSNNQSVPEESNENKTDNE